MNVYDQVHQLATAIKESEECKQYKAAQEKVAANPELDEAINDFMKKQFTFQTSQMMGQEVSEEDFAMIQQLSAVLMQDPLAVEYFQCQMRFSTMMADVYNIIKESVDFGLGPMGDLGNM